MKARKKKKKKKKRKQKQAKRIEQNPSNDCWGHYV